MSPPSPRPTVPAEALRALCLVRAFEEADPDGLVLSGHERSRAAPAGDAGLQPEQALVRRAEQLAERITERVRGTSEWLAASRAEVPALLLGALALALGLATNLLAERFVSVLAFPLLGALVWNLAVYAGLAWGALRGAHTAGPRTGPGGLLRRAAQALVTSRVRRALLGSRGESAAVSAAAAADFARLWISAARALLAARVRRALHLGAAALSLGMVAGMYLRGLAFEYRATWESTFLGERTAEALIGLVLAPARLLLGIETPALAELRAPASGDAAPWIHLWAATALLFVIVPRALLWLVETGRVARLERGLPLDLEEPYYRRLLAPLSGAGVHVLVAPFAAALGARSFERLGELLHDLLGARAQIVQRPPLDYGAEAGELSPEGESGCLVLVFQLAQTPELEVHVRLLGDLAARLAAQQRLLVVVDAGDFAGRMGGGAEGEQRLDERRRAWERAAREAHLAVLHLDLSGALDAGALQRAGAALWSAGRGRRPT